MSFVPVPQQASTANANYISTSSSNNNNSNNNNSNNNNNASAQVNAGATGEEPSEKEAIFTLRTFDSYWVDKKALMYKDGVNKVRLVAELILYLCRVQCPNVSIRDCPSNTIVDNDGYLQNQHGSHFVASLCHGKGLIWWFFPAPPSDFFLFFGTLLRNGQTDGQTCGQTNAHTWPLTKSPFRLFVPLPLSLSLLFWE